MVQVGGQIAEGHAEILRPFQLGVDAATVGGQLLEAGIGGGTIWRARPLAAPSFALANALDIDALSRDPAVGKAYSEDPLVHNRVSARLGLDIIETGPRIVARAAEIILPLLLMQGSTDRIVDPAATARFAAAAGKNVTYRVFEGWYHELHNEPEKAEVLAAITGWLATKV